MIEKVEVKLFNKAKKSKKKLAKECDKLWSELIKMRAGNVCEKCGRAKTLNSHHVYSRSNKSVRWDVDNGCCLCAGCHALSSTFSAHKTPIEFVEWIKDKRGETWYVRLRMKANSISKVDLMLEKLYLENELKELSS